MDSSTQKKNDRQSHNITGSNYLSFDKASDFIEDNENDKLNLEDLLAFFTKGFGAQLLQDWSYYSQSSDSGMFTKSTIILSKFLALLSTSQETIQHAVDIIKQLLTSYQKTIYRALSAIKASVTNPTIRLLNEIVIFNKGALLDDFFALFDFSLAVLPKLLHPPKHVLKNIEKSKENENLTIRYCFIRLLLNILKYSAPLSRKDFIVNNMKLSSAWFKHISTVDSQNLIEITLAIWDEKILKEISFKRATKLKFFNEWNLTKLTPLYYTLKGETRSTFNEFILCLATDSTYGLKFPQDETWFVGEAPYSALSVNQKYFKLNNKLFYSLVSNLKPWDDDTQLKTTVEILQETPELIPPFTNYLASRGLHDPKLTSYWLGQTLLISKIIRSDIPKEITDYNGGSVPSHIIIAELIVPSVLNRSVLLKCLQSDLLLIRQLSVQLIVDALQKLQVFVTLYEEKNWIDAKVELLNHIYSLLPELSSITSCLTDSYSKNPEKKVLLATLLTALNGYSIFTDSHNISQAISKPFMDVINGNSFTSMDLVLLDNFFNLQEGETSQIKWWNKTDNSTSLFTSLIKLASSNQSVRAKVTNLLSNLIKQTVVFNYDAVKEDPTIVLIHSLACVTNGQDLESDELIKIWKLLDESISRCVRTPFKYLDQSNENKRVSPLIITIFEQWKFVDKTTNYKLSSKWLVLFLHYLIIIGEPSSVLIELLKHVELDFEFEDYVFTDSYESSIPKIQQEGSFKELSSLCFFEFVTTSSYNDILNTKHIPVTDFDVVGALSRVSSIIQSDETSLKNSETVLSNILTKVGDYWYSHPKSLKKFSSAKFWETLYLQIPGEKALHVSNILGDIFEQLDSFDKAEFSEKVTTLLLQDLTKEQEVVLSGSLWSLNNEKLRATLETGSDIIKSSALNLLLERKLSIHSETLSKLLTSTVLISILNEFVVQDLVIFNDYTAFFKSIIHTKGTLPIFKSISKNGDATSELLEFSLAKDDPIFVAYIASSFTSESINDIEDSESLNLVLVKGKQKSLELIEKEDYSHISFSQLLNIFTNGKVEVSEEEKQSIINYALTKTSNKYTPEISSLVKSFGSIDSADVKTWINKSVLYLTKIYAEYTEFPSSFPGFVNSFRDLLFNIKANKLLNKVNVNALLEVIFTKWIKDETALEFASVLIIVSTKSLIEFNRLLQILVNKEEITLLKSGSSKSKFYTSLIISRLFNFDASKNSNIALQEKILTFYNGSTKVEDLLLFDILEKMESKLNASWIDRVFNWEFLELLNDSEEELIGKTKLIQKKKEGFLITLNKKFIVNGLKHYDVERHTLPSDKWSEIQNFYESVSISSPDAYSKTRYHPLFLSLLIINNDELIEITKDEESSDLVVKSNMKKMIESLLFNSIIMNLSTTDETLLKITKSILGSLLNSLKSIATSSTFKDRHIFELLITKILYTFEQPEYDSSQYPPLVYTFIANLVPVLNNPGHMLFEKAYKWVMKSPSVRGNEIPLFNEITTISTGGEDSEVYYKEVTWLLTYLTDGIKTKSDIQLLRNKNFFEWLMNLQNSPYAYVRIKYLTIELLSVLQETEEGADILISRFGGLSHLEQRITSVFDELKERNDVDELQKKQELLNLKQIAIKYGINLKSKKRLSEWTTNDVGGYVKRMLKN